MGAVYNNVTDNVATVRLSRGKVNALNMDVVNELGNVFESIKTDPSIKAIVLTGDGKFFSFGFDVPHFLSYAKADYSLYLEKFTGLYTSLFGFPKPVIAALNGHAVAGGCMLALACDMRIMVDGKAKISLNEITFGSSVLAGSVEMLRFCVGDKNAQKVLYSGAMYTAHEAEKIGLIDRVSTAATLTDDAFGEAKTLMEKPPAAFAGIKSLLRGPILEKMVDRESASIAAFLDIWYSDDTRKNLKKILITK